MRNFKNMDKAAYNEYMEHFNKAYNAFDKVMENAQKIDNIKLEYGRKKYIVDSDPRISETHRAEQVAALHKAATQNLAAVWSVVENLLPSFSEELEAIAETIDLNDARLTTAVALATAAGASGASIGAQNALCEPFVGNLDALNMLRPVALAPGLDVAVGLIDGHIATLNKANQFVDMAYNTMQGGTLTPEGDFVMIDIMPYAAALAKVYNFTLPEIPEELQLAAVRVAMGLPVGFPDGFVMEGAKVDGKPVYTVTGEPV